MFTCQCTSRTNQPCKDQFEASRSVDVILLMCQKIRMKMSLSSHALPNRYGLSAFIQCEVENIELLKDVAWLQSAHWHLTPGYHERRQNALADNLAHKVQQTVEQSPPHFLLSDEAVP